MRQYLLVPNFFLAVTVTHEVRAAERAPLLSEVPCALDRELALQNSRNPAFSRRQWLHPSSVIASLAFVLAAVAVGFAILGCYRALRTQSLRGIHGLRSRRISASGSKSCSVS